MDYTIEIEWAKSKSKQNPFIYRHTYTIGFYVPRLASVDPLWWTGGGFKDLSKGPSRNPQEFKTENEAKCFIETEILTFIKRWRADDPTLFSDGDRMLKRKYEVGRNFRKSN